MPKLRSNVFSHYLTKSGQRGGVKSRQDSTIGSSFLMQDDQPFLDNAGLIQKRGQRSRSTLPHSFSSDTAKLRSVGTFLFMAWDTPIAFFLLQSLVALQALSEGQRSLPSHPDGMACSKQISRMRNLPLWKQKRFLHLKGVWFPPTLFSCTPPPPSSS